MRKKKEAVLLKCCRTNWIDKKNSRLLLADKAHQAIYPGFTDKYNSLLFYLMVYWYVDRRRFGFRFQWALENKDVSSSGFFRTRCFHRSLFQLLQKITWVVLVIVWLGYLHRLGKRSHPCSAQLHQQQCLDGWDWEWDVQLEEGQGSSLRSVYFVWIEGVNVSGCLRSSSALVLN